MITVLFDIDGTLLRARGAGLAAIQQTMQEMFGVSDLPQVSVHGRTDCGILQDFFKPFGLSFEEHRDAFLESYCRHLRGRLPEFPGHVLPGVVALLERLAGDENMALGLVTGNCRKAAQLKIEHFELTPYFCGLGGYGDNSANRDDVARDAVRAVRNRWPERYDARQCEQGQENDQQTTPTYQPLSLAAAFFQQQTHRAIGEASQGYQPTEIPFTT